MHKKDKFNKSRQERRVRAMARFPTAAIEVKAASIRADQGKDKGDAYIALRFQEKANLAARIAGSSLIGA